MFPWLTGLSLKEKEQGGNEADRRQQLETGLSWGLEPQGAAAMTHGQLRGYCRHQGSGEHVPGLGGGPL